MYIVCCSAMRCDAMWRAWSITKYNKTHIIYIYTYTLSLYLRMSHVVDQPLQPISVRLRPHARHTAYHTFKWICPYTTMDTLPQVPLDGSFLASKTKGCWTLLQKGSIFSDFTGKWPVHVTHSLVQYLPIRKIMHTQINAGKRIFFRRIWHFFPGSFQIWLFFPIRLAHSPARKFQKE